MKLWTINELKHLTHSQLMELRELISVQLEEFEHGSADHALAQRSLQNIHFVLTCRHWRVSPSPCL